MSSTPPLNPNTFRYPFAIQDQPHEVQQAHLYAFQGILDLQNAISALNSKVQAIKSGGTTTVNTSTGGGTIIINGNNFPGLGGVNNQTGATAYKTLASDNGIFLIFGDASPVTLTMDSALTTPFFFFASNFGTSNVTLSPTTGTVNQPTIPVGGLYIVVFDGANWEASALITGGGGTVSNSATPIILDPDSPEEPMLIPGPPGAAGAAGAAGLPGPIIFLEPDSPDEPMMIPGPTPTGTGSGTVTSVGLAMPPDFIVTNSPVTTTGTLTASRGGVYTTNFATAARNSTGALSAAIGPSNPTKQNAILVITYNAGGTPPVPTDGVNVYTPITSIISGAFISIQAFLAVNIAGGATTIGATTSGLGAFYAWEIRNILGVSGFDAYGLTQTGSGAPLAITATATTTNANDYLLGIDLAQITTVSGTWNSPFISRTAAGPDVNGVNFFMGDANVATAGSQSVTFNASVTTGQHNLLLIGLKVATGVQDLNGRVGHVILTGTDVPVFGASGASHAQGTVPDPGSTAGSSRFLCEDGTWAAPAGTGAALTLIQRQTLGSAAASVTFSSIPNTFGTLVLIVNAVSATAAVTDDLWLQFNSDTASNYANSNGYTDNAGTHQFASTGTTTPDIATIGGANAFVKFGTLRLEIPNYAGTVIAKSWTSQSAAPASGSTKEVQNHYASGMWNSTAAINAIKLAMFSGANFITGSVFALYGMS